MGQCRCSSHPLSLCEKQINAATWFNSIDLYCHLLEKSKNATFSIPSSDLVNKEHKGVDLDANTGAELNAVQWFNKVDEIKLRNGFQRGWGSQDSEAGKAVQQRQTTSREQAKSKFWNRSKAKGHETKDPKSLGKCWNAWHTKTNWVLILLQLRACGVQSYI